MQSPPSRRPWRSRSPLSSACFRHSARRRAPAPRNNSPRSPGLRPRRRSPITTGADIRDEPWRQITRRNADRHVDVKAAVSALICLARGASRISRHPIGRGRSRLGVPDLRREQRAEPETVIGRQWSRPCGTTRTQRSRPPRYAPRGPNKPVRRDLLCAASSAGARPHPPPGGASDRAVSCRRSPRHRGASTRPGGAGRRSRCRRCTTPLLRPVVRQGPGGWPGATSDDGEGSQSDCRP